MIIIITFDKQIRYRGLDGNISHRIERFHFGPHIWGLVTPLAGNEQFATKRTDFFLLISRSNLLF